MQILHDHFRDKIAENALSHLTNINRGPDELPFTVSVIFILLHIEADQSHYFDDLRSVVDSHVKGGFTRFRLRNVMRQVYIHRVDTAYEVVNCNSATLSQRKKFNF